MGACDGRGPTARLGGRRTSRPRRSPLAAALLALCFLFAAAAPAGANVHPVPTRAEHVVTTVTAARTVSLTAPAEHVAVYWSGSPQARVTLAFSSDGTHFGEPVDAGRDELGEQRDNGTTYGAVQEAHGAVAVRVMTDHPISRLTVLGMSDGTAAAQRSAPGARAVAAAVQPLAAAVAQPLVVSRAQWGADERYMTWAPQFYQTRKLIVHHTATSNDYADQAAAESDIRSIYSYHAVTQGWGDIGYNFLIDKFGNVYEGRYSRNYNGANPSGDDVNGNGVTGAHTSGWNSGTVGVAMLGTFTGQDITTAARNSLEALLAWEASRNGINPQATESFTNPVSGATITTPNIAGHLDYSATECPGGTFYGTLPTLRLNVSARINGGTTADTTAPTAPSSLNAVGGRRQVTLTWAASTDNVGVVGYRVWRSRTSSGSFTQVASVSGRSYLNTGLSSGVTYYYKVQAYDATGNISAFSNLAYARTM